MSVKRTAELVGITDLLDRKPRQLSGGEAQRAALSRAIVREPRAFLMGEPLSNLDEASNSYELNSKDCGKIQVTTIYVTHDQLEAKTMADKIAIMNPGLLQQQDDAHEICHHPANRFVAGFIGGPSTNFKVHTHGRKCIMYSRCWKLHSLSRQTSPC